jgi:O-acetyl-ADP-ribose deacetylase (regulator of RNase III)
MTKINVRVGDLLDEEADVVISTGNPWLNMSGGVNGAILAQSGEAIQEELREYLLKLGKPAVVPGTVVETGPGRLKVKRILHAVAIDPFYVVGTILANGCLLVNPGPGQVPPSGIGGSLRL